MAAWFVVSALAVLLRFDAGRGAAVQTCPGSASSYFIADDSDPCVFYWCLNGALISESAMNCAPGTGVVPGYAGEGNPCTTHNARCSGQLYPSGGNNGGSYPGGGWHRPQGPHYPPGHPHHPGPHIPPRPVPAPPSAPGPASPSRPSQGQQGYYAATAYLTQNAHIPGGMLHPHVHSLKYCWKACVYSYNCKGFDYDPRYRTCWLHAEQTICTPLEYKAYVNNFRLVYCPSTTMAPPTTVTEVTEQSTTIAPPLPAPKPIATFEGTHLLGGVLQPDIHTEEDCFAACQANAACQGLDFDKATSSCWIHTPASECGQLVLKLTCTHYRFMLCEDPLVIPSTHAVGGTLISAISDPISCFAQCLDPCVAVDFDSTTMSCWHHTDATCRSLEIKAQCVHMRRPGKCN